MATGKSPTWFRKNGTSGRIENTASTSGQDWLWDNIYGLKLDDAAIANYQAATGVAGKSLFMRLQSALDSNLSGASLTTTTGAKHGAGTDGSLTWRAGLHYFEPQASAGNTYLTIDAATGLGTEIRFDAGSSITTGFAFSYAGTKALIMDDADPSEFTATAAAGKPTYLRTQSGADNGSGAGYAGADYEIRTGDGGDGTTAGGSGGVCRVVCGNAGTGGTGANGSFQVWHGTEGALDYAFMQHDATDAIFGAASGLVKFRSNGVSMIWSGTKLYYGTPNTVDIGSTAEEWRAGFFGEDTVGGPAVSTSGLYLGLAQEARLRWNKDATGYPAASLILGLNAVGSAASDRLALSASAITGFAAGTTTAGGALFAALQGGGAAAAAEGFAGASGTLTAGAGSNAVSGVGGAGGGWSLVASAGGTGTTTGGAGGGITLTGGAGGNGTTGGVGGGVSVVLGAAGTGGSPLGGAFSITGVDSYTYSRLGVGTYVRAGIATTSTDALVLENTTAATDGVRVQYSPRLRLRGQAYRYNAGAQNETHDWIAEVQPVAADAANTSSNFYIRTSRAGGAYSTPLYITSGGSLVATSYYGTLFSTLTAVTCTVQNSSFTAADSAIEAATGTWTHAAGEGVALEVKPTWNASGTASETCLKINSTSTAVGSGAYNFLTCLDDTALKFNLDSTAGALSTMGATATWKWDAGTTAHTGTTGVLDVDCIAGATGVVGLDVSMTTPAAGLGAGESMYALSLNLIGDAQDNAAAIVYGVNLGFTANGGAAKAYGVYSPATLTYALYTLADVYIGAADIETDTTTGMKLGTGATQKIGLYGATPVVQGAHIADADGSLADITTKFNTLLTRLEATTGIGLLASS